MDTLLNYYVLDTSFLVVDNWILDSHKSKICKNILLIISCSLGL